MIEKMEMLIRLLKSHDWYFEYSDDHTIWRRGRNSLDTISELVAELGDDGQAMFNKYCPWKD